MDERERNLISPQYCLDIISASLERTIKRLWIALIITIVLFAGYVVYDKWEESQYMDVVITQEVEQDADNGENHFIGGDYYGEAKSENDG